MNKCLNIFDLEEFSEARKEGLVVVVRESLEKEFDLDEVVTEARETFDTQT